MDLNFSDEEKSFFRKLQQLRNSNGAGSLPPTKLDSLLIKNIILNDLVPSGIEPGLGELNALIDDIENYIKKSIDEFISFMKESNVA